MIITISIILIIVGIIYKYYPNIKGVFIKKKTVEPKIQTVHKRIFNAKSKCFDCEKQSKNPYMTGPTKCFSCD